MPLVVSIVGKSNSGKTTLIEKLIGELNLRGYRVATIKHTIEGVSFDNPGKDSWRHIHAGSAATVFSSPDSIVLVRPVVADAPLDELARLLDGDYDIILAEGFKQGNSPKIEVHRRDAGPPLKDIKQLIAIATDEPLDTETRQFSLDDFASLTDLLEKDFIKAFDG